ncbi:MAG: hypothetical protein ABSC23_12360 [Bryobacteraceae bacterium]
MTSAVYCLPPGVKPPYVLLGEAEFALHPVFERMNADLSEAADVESPATTRRR